MGPHGEAPGWSGVRRSCRLRLLLGSLRARRDRMNSCEQGDDEWLLWLVLASFGLGVASSLVAG